jgi:hypothetical protein
MTRASPADRARHGLNVLLAVGQVAASFLPELAGYGRPLGEGEPGVTANPAAPPGPAFAIWGLLFPAVLAYAVYQGAPRRAAVRHVDRLVQDGHRTLGRFRPGEPKVVRRREPLRAARRSPAAAASSTRVTPDFQPRVTTAGAREQENDPRTA